MRLEEKEQLLALFDEEGRWCKESEARDRNGNPVSYNDDTAAAWDLVGGLCHLFGWRRACQLFRQLQRHIMGQPIVRYYQDADMLAMTALLDFNDASDTTYNKVVATIQEMPVSRSTKTSRASSRS